jgi:hypothetical protein
MATKSHKRKVAATRSRTARTTAPVKPARIQANTKTASQVLRWQRMLPMLRLLRHNRFAHVLVLWALSFMILAAYFFSEVLSPGNLVEVFPREFTFPLLLHAATALLVAGAIYALPRPRTFGPKAVAVVLLTLFLVDYNSRLTVIAPVMKTFIPVLPANPMPVLSLLLLATLLGISVGAGVLLERLKSRYPNITSTNVLGLACIIVVWLFIGQALSILRVSGTMHAEEAYTPTTELNQAKTMHPQTSVDKPDIYYIVLDRYTNNDVLKKQFGFDNTPFLDGLRNQGFSIDDTALSSYPYTAPSVSSTLNMSYHNDDIKDFKNDQPQSAILFHAMAEQSQVVKLLQGNGYTYHSIGSTYGVSYRAPLTVNDYACDQRLRVFNKEKCLHGVEALQFEKSIFYQFADVPIKGWPVHYDEIKAVDYVRTQLDKLHELADSPQQGGRFIFAHILVPHDPFYFLADGSLSPYTNVDQEGMPVKEKYVNQVEFINTQISQLVSRINEKSAGKAVIMLVSDEGPYPSAMNQTFMKPIDWGGIGDIVDNSDMTKWTNDELHMKFGTLQAYHIPSATTDDLAAISPPNAFRVVLDRYFNYDYPLLPKCQMGLPDGRHNVYTFKDITGLMTGTDNSSCKQYQ